MTARRFLWVVVAMGTAVVILVLLPRGEKGEAIPPSPTATTSRSAGDDRAEVGALARSWTEALVQGDLKRRQELCTPELARDIGSQPAPGGRPSECQQETRRISMSGDTASAVVLLRREAAQGIGRELLLNFSFARTAAGWRVSDVEAKPYLVELHAKEAMP